MGQKKLCFTSSVLLLHALLLSLSLSLFPSHSLILLKCHCHSLDLSFLLHSFIHIFITFSNLILFHYFISDDLQLHSSYHSLVLISFHTSSLLLSPLPLRSTRDHLYPWSPHWAPDQERAAHTWTGAISMGDRTVRYRISSIQSQL